MHKYLTSLRFSIINGGTRTPLFLYFILRAGTSEDKIFDYRVHPKGPRMGFELSENFYNVQNLLNGQSSNVCILLI
jgi:hypothetical protein